MTGIIFPHNGLIKKKAAAGGFPDETLNGGNILAQPYDFTNAEWVKNVGTDTVTGSQADPNGGTGAYKLTPGGTNSNNHSLRDINITTTAVNHTFNVRCKADGYNFVELLITRSESFGAFYAVVFNLSTGAFVSSRGTGYTSTGAYAITEVGGSFYRCSISCDVEANSTHSVYIKSCSTTSPLGAFVGDGTSGTILWGAEFFPT